MLIAAGGNPQLPALGTALIPDYFSSFDVFL